MIEYCLGFLFHESVDDLVLLIQKTKPDWQKGLLNGIGGKIEYNEKPLDAMKREFLEEADLLIENWKNFAIIEGKDYKIWCYKAYDNIFCCRAITEEQIYVCNLALQNINNMKVVDHLKFLIPLAKSKDILIPTVFYFK